jgi:hypothetical protein
MFFEDLVAVASLRVESHGVGQAGATAALNADAQAALFGRNTILFEQRADFLRGTLGQVDFRDIRTYDVSSHDESSLEKPNA